VVWPFLFGSDVLLASASSAKCNEEDSGTTMFSSTREASVVDKASIATSAMAQLVLRELLLG
jgi:hypothetical protein